MRTPSVAGKFYPSKVNELTKEIQSCFVHHLGPGKLPSNKILERDIVGAVVPHAGYMYSGPEAAHVYYALSNQKKPVVVIALGPNHTGLGGIIATSNDVWKTPLGEVKVEGQIVDKFCKECSLIDIDEDAHRFEHSIEVQLPFLQFIYGDFNFVPIVMRNQDLETCQELAKCIAIDQSLILASSDFSHYEEKNVAFEKDKKVMKCLLAMDEKKFIQTVNDLDVSVCGYGPIAVCLSASKMLGATKCEILKYGSSGDITGDDSSVVAYSAILFRR